MTAWGEVAVCTAGGAIAGPLLDFAARRHLAQRAAVSASAGAAAAVEEADVAPSGVLPAAPGMVTADSVAPVAPTTDAVPAGTTAAVAAVVTAVLFGLAAFRLGAVPQLAAYCVLFGGLVAVSSADLRAGLVPRRLLYPAFVLLAVALVGASAAGDAWRPFLDGLIGGVVAFAVFAAVWWVVPRGMGFGDVRLAGYCGAGLGWLGFRQLYLGFLAAFVLGTVLGVGMLVVRGTRRFPFAPALAAGTAFGVLWGGWLGNLWLHPG